MPRSLLFLVILTTLSACSSATPAPSPPAAPPAPASTVSAPASTSGATPVPVVDESVRAAVDAPDRDPADRALDAGRHPAELLSFFGVHAGMRVAELGAGGGYTTELLARTVGSSGKVYGQNSKFLLERFAEKPWSERLAKPVMKNVE